MVVAATGGAAGSLLGWRISITDPTRLLLLGGGLGVWQAWAGKSLVPAGVDRALARLFGQHHVLAAVLAAGVLFAAVNWGSTAGGGSDSSGYLNEARLWRSGHLTVPQPIAGDSPWPVASTTWTPLGFVGSVREPGAIVPSYPPGLPLLMAAAQWLFGFCGAFLITPIAGAATTIFTYMLGRRVFARPAVALAGAALVSISPIFLFQVMNPMTDVPVTAAWALTLLLLAIDRPGWAGLAMGAALAIRPNLVPVLLAPFLWSALLDLRERRRTGHLGRRTLRLGCAVAPAIAGVAAFNALLYGSPLMSGYGSASNLYALAHLRTNVEQFGRWTLQSETPIVLLAAAALAAPRFLGATRISYPRVLLGGMIAGVLLSYVLYVPFDAWWFLRFLLPMWPALMLTTAAAVIAIGDLVPREWRKAGATLLAGVLLWHALAFAWANSVFRLGAGERRYADVGRYMSERTDPAAVAFSLQHSGSIRLYSGRLTLRYDLLDPLWLDRAVQHLFDTGHHPYFVLDKSEVARFKQRFAGASRLGAIDWIPRAALDGGDVVVFDPLDVARFNWPEAIRSTAGQSGLRACHPFSE